jgi:hypothetical protein
MLYISSLRSHRSQAIVLIISPTEVQPVVLTPDATRNSRSVVIGIAGATQLRYTLGCASVEATQLGMGIGSAPEGANLETSAEALESGNWPTGIKALYIAL